jgi:phosphoribosylanthranilate isomerase
MSLVLPVKLSSVTNLSDARYGAGMGVQLMGFCMSPDNPHRINPEEFTAITGWLSGPEFVGEFDPGTPLDIITATAQAQQVYWVEVHEEDLVKPLQDAGIKVILAMDMTKEASLSVTPDYLRVYSQTDSFAVDDYVDVLKELNKRAPLLLASGLEADKISAWYEASALSGVAVAGGEEIRPGFKDFDALADILEALEVED